MGKFDHVKPVWKANPCGTCNEDFEGMAAYNAHKGGGSPHFSSGVLTMRQCMTVEEMQRAGLRKNGEGRWGLPS